MNVYSFPNCYEDSLARFKLDFEIIQQRWPHARLISQPLPGRDELTIDWIEAPPAGTKERVLVFTAGEHGIEAFVGTTVRRLLVKEFIPRLDPQTTGLALVHVINPWGMLHRRRTNSHNIDLNRNFILPPQGFDPGVNPAYSRVDPFLNPARRLNGMTLEKGRFLLSLIKVMLTHPAKEFKAASLNGQYAHPAGIYYGGTDLQPETRMMVDLYRRLMNEYRQFLLLDMHTGYGPRRQMSVVNSYFEPRSSQECCAQFDYPLVVKADPAEFYSIHGDMIDALYAMEKPARLERFFATCFEFGTFGDSLWAGIRALRAMIFENQMAHHGAASGWDKEMVDREFLELYAPAGLDWQEKAWQDARQAINGILTAEGYF